MTAVRYWKTLERHPKSAEYEDIKGKQWTAFVQYVREKGIMNNRKIMLYDGKVVDGWQLQRACVEVDRKPGYVTLKLPKDVTLDEWLSVVQDLRRHESAEAAMARVNERVERVEAARAEGKSISEIADEEGISKTQAARDLDKAASKNGKTSKKPPKTEKKKVGAAFGVVVRFFVKHGLMKRFERWLEEMKAAIRTTG